MKSIKLLAALLVGLAVAFPVAAQDYQEGTHYTRLAEPVSTPRADKIEVAEIFSYACGHCFNFEARIEPWKADLPEDVTFVRWHVKWDRMTENLARALYTAQALNVMDTVHPALFQAIHLERKRVQNQKQIAEIFVKHGVDQETFDKTFTSFGIGSQVNQGDAKIKGAQIRGTPSLLVDGRYVIEARQNIDHEAMLKIADFLVAKAREERGL